MDSRSTVIWMSRSKRLEKQRNRVTANQIVEDICDVKLRCIEDVSNPALATLIAQASQYLPKLFG